MHMQVNKFLQNVYENSDLIGNMCKGIIMEVYICKYLQKLFQCLEFKSLPGKEKEKVSQITSLTKKHLLTM